MSGTFRRVVGIGPIMRVEVGGAVGYCRREGLLRVDRGLGSCGEEGQGTLAREQLCGGRRVVLRWSLPSS